MTDQSNPADTPTILCRNCGRSIRKTHPPTSHWYHNSTGLAGCFGKATEAEPREGD